MRRTYAAHRIADGRVMAEDQHDFDQELDSRRVLAAVEKLSKADQQALWAVVAPRRDEQYPSCQQLCPEAPHRIRYRGHRVLAQLKTLVHSDDSL